MDKKHSSPEEIENLLNRLSSEIRSPKGAFSAGASYSRFKQRTLPAGKKRLFGWKHYASAAAVILAIGLFTLQFLLPDTTPDVIKVFTTDQVRNLSLPDGTKVSLSRYSSLVYPTKFIGEIREVHFEGEGYFEVAKDKKHPFIVKTSDVSVKVLGTHFNIQAYREDSIVLTTLLEGAVAVSNHYNTQTLFLQPNEEAVFHRNSHKLILRENRQAMDEIAWLNGIFLFNQTTLGEITRELSNFYAVSIRIDDEKLRSYRITARFKQSESLDQILSLLQATGYFNYSRVDNIIRIDPN